MKKCRTGCRSLKLLLVLVLPTVVQTQDFSYRTNNGTISVGQYKGTEGGAIIPSKFNGLPVTRIDNSTFAGKTNLLYVSIPSSVTNIGNAVFMNCTRLHSIFCHGNAFSFGSDTLYGAPNAFYYYLSGTTGWPEYINNHGTVLWTSKIETSDISFGIGTNGFGFTISGSGGLCSIEISTNLANNVWIPIATNRFGYFSDPQWSNYPGRFYRLSMP